jgi:hypothetical protein
VAVFVDLVGKIFALRHGETLTGKEVRLAREKAYAIDAMPLRFREQRFDKASTPTFALCPRCNRYRANFRQMSPVEMQRSATDDAAFIFEDHEVPHVLTDFR